MDRVWVVTTEVCAILALVALAVVVVVVVRLVLKARRLMRSVRGVAKGFATEARATHEKVRRETGELKERMERVGEALRASSGRIREGWRCFETRSGEHGKS